MSITFKATNDQLMQMGANATNASAIVGMGAFQAMSHPDKISPEFFREWVEVHMRMDLDYVAGRMVKLYIEFLGDQVWKINNTNINIEYQSWGGKYSTYPDLLNSVNITDYEIAQ